MVVGLVRANGAKCVGAISVATFVLGAGSSWAQVTPDQISNFEYAHVTPLAATPNGDQVLAVNTPNGSVEVYDINGGGLSFSSAIKVGLEPVSVRMRTQTEAWVVNAASDSVSIIDLSTQMVTQTLNVCDQPGDVVFADTPQKAYISCSGSEWVSVFDAETPTTEISRIGILGEQPRAMAVSADGSEVYLGIFESGNGTTALTAKDNCCESRIVGTPGDPYGGVNPPPNDGAVFNPPLNPNIAAPSTRTSMIVRRTLDGDWLDDNGMNWREQVTNWTGAQSSRTRIQGWDLIDRDIAVINVADESVTYKGNGLNMVMGLAVHPTTGQVTAVGTDATNEIRFEPVINGVFLRVLMSTYGNTIAPVLNDLNPHLDYSTPTVPLAVRETSLGDPRGIAWYAGGSKAIITGMGSNNAVIVNANGDRAGQAQTIELGEGPTGVVIVGDSAIVLNRFDASLSMIDLTSERETARVPFSVDPTPQVIKDGRPLIYDTHATSGTGHVSCGSCHVDSRTDRLAWDLGNPAGEMEVANGQMFHPMKGPFLTMTLVDTVQSDILHWRGDREGIEHFVGAFVSLQGMEQQPSDQDMANMRAFLETTRTAPNPYRNLDNSYSTAVEMRGPGGDVFRVGNAILGAERFEASCRRCHDGHTGRGTLFRQGSEGRSFTGGQILNPPKWQNFYLRDGLWFRDATASTTGFGFQQDGTFDSTHNNTRSDDLMAFMYSFNGSFPYEPRGLSDQTVAVDAHAAVGVQVTLAPGATSSVLLDDLMAIAASGAVEMTAQACVDGLRAGFLMAADGSFIGDATGVTATLADLTAMAADLPVTFTAVRNGTGEVFALDENADGVLDGDGDQAGRECADGPIIPPFEGENIVINGDFFSPVVPSGGWRQTRNVEGWTNRTSRPIEVWAGLFGIAGPNGESTLIELDARANTTPDRVAQVLPTQAGDVVEISFAHRARPNTPLATNVFNLLWNGAVVATINPQTGWETATFVVDAQGSDEIAFEEAAGTDNGAGSLITAVSAVVQEDDPLTTVDVAVNGNFFSPVVPSGGWRQTRNVEGWANSNNRAVEVWNGLLGLSGPDGQSSMIEVDVANAATLDQISQSVSGANPGAAVEIKFDFAGRPNTAAATNAFDVLWNGGVIGSFTPTGNGVFQEASFDVTATGSDVLSFREGAGTSNGLGALITGVEILVTQ